MGDRRVYPCARVPHHRIRVLEVQFVDEDVDHSNRVSSFGKSGVEPEATRAIITSAAQGTVDTASH